MYVVFLEPFLSDFVQYEFVKQYSSQPDTFVVAVVREVRETDPLHTLAASSHNIGVVPLEMTDYASFEVSGTPCGKTCKMTVSASCRSDCRSHRKPN